MLYRRLMDDGKDFGSHLVKAYRSGRRIHRYEWLSAVNTCTGRGRILDTWIFYLHTIAETLPREGKVWEDAGDAYLSQKSYETGLSRLIDWDDPNRTVENAKEEAEARPTRDGPLPWPLPVRHWNRICDFRRVVHSYLSGLHRSAFELGYVVDDGLVSLDAHWISAPDHDTTIDRLRLSSVDAWCTEIRSRCKDLKLQQSFLYDLYDMMCSVERFDGLDGLNTSAFDKLELIDYMIRNALSELDKPKEHDKPDVSASAPVEGKSTGAGESGGKPVVDLQKTGPDAKQTEFEPSTPPRKPRGQVFAYHSLDELRPEKFKFGPIEGPQKELAKWILANGKPNPKRLRRFADKTIWFVQLDSRQYQAWFQYNEIYARAKSKRDAFESDGTAGPTDIEQ